MANTSSNIIQTAPSTPSSSFSKPQSKYEVFLSFRGKDTRYTFTDHLYHALAFDKGIKTFRDGEELEMGSPIEPELLDAIETSTIAVIILSRNYASSWWCLEELAKIIECKKERGMKVLPVFYHLDPSVVRYQNGSFKDDFAKHEERFEEKMVKKWRAALEEVAHLSGHHLKDGLKSLTNIPLSTQYVMGRECTSLENYSNQVTVWTSGESGFTFINCLSLGDNEECNMSDINLESRFTFINCLSLGDDEESQIHDLKLLDVHFQPLWQRYMKEKIEQSEGFQGVIPQTEIPEWFRHQNPGSIVPILLPPDLYENSNWRGIALCLVFVVNSNRDSKCFHEFICRLDIDGGVVDSPLVFTFSKDQFYPGSFGLWLYISHEKFMERVDVRGCISPSVTTNCPDVEIKLFGARLLYEGDMVQFVQNFSRKRFRSPDALRQRHQQFIHAHMNYSMCQKCCEPIPWLERELKKLLSRLYQGDPARNHWYDYIFPHISIPRWFSHQNFPSEIRMQLPPDLHNNTRWMGFSVYALYTVYRQPYSSGQDPTIILSFSGLSAGEAPFAPYMALPRSGDIFLGSRRLLVFYIPRVLFGLNQCTEIWASFQSNNPRVLKVETCGIRLVDEQDVEEFVEALHQCMLNCPSRLFHYNNLYNQVEDLQGCDHGKDFSCSFSLQRRPKLLPSIENVAEEGCTSPETFSNQASNSRNSTSLILGIPLRDEQCGSTSSIGIVQQTFLERWFKTHLQVSLSLFLSHTHALTEHKHLRF